MPPDDSDVKDNHPGDGTEDGKADAPAEAAAPDDAQADEMLSLDDDDLEMMELDDGDIVAGEALANERPPPTPPAPPPVPVAAVAPEPEVDEILDETPAPDDGDGSSDVDVSDDADDAVPVAAAPGEGGAEVDTERQLESPTVLELAVDESSAENWGLRAELVRAELEGADDRVRIGALAYELGELYERHLDDEARAVQSFGQALKADPSLRANLWAIRRVFYRRGLWPNLVKLIDAEIRFARDNRERAVLAVEKGHLLEDQLGKPADARAAYDQALGFDPECVGALRALERRAVADADEDQCLDLWRRLADAATMPERKLVYLRDLIRVHRTRGEDGIERAREILSEALALGVDIERLARERQRLAELADDPDDLLMALEAQIKPLTDSFGPAGPPEPPQSPRPPDSELDRETQVRFAIAALRRRQSRIARSKLDDPQRAWEYLERAMELAPGEPLVVGDLADLAESMGKFDALAGLCLRLQSLEPSPERRVALELRRADALVRAGNSEDARQHLDDLASQSPGYLPVTALAERSALANGDAAALAQTIGAAAEAALLGVTFGSGGAEDRPGAAARFVAAGDLYLYSVNDEEHARARYAQALEAVPGYPPAVDALATLHEIHGRPDDAAQLLELHTETGDEAFRRELLERLSRIYDEGGRLDDALGALRRLLDLDPTDRVRGPDNDRVRWRIEDLLAALGRAEERAGVLGDLAERTDNPDRRAAIQLEIARIFDEEVDDAARALGAYRAVLEVWPTDRYARAAVASLLRRAERWEDLLAARVAEAEHLPDGPAVARALREAGSILTTHLNRPAEAVELYRALLDRVPTDVYAARALRDALELAEDHDALLEVLEREVEAQSDPDARSAALARLADQQVRAGRLDDAADAYRRACEPNDSRAGASEHARLGAWHLAVRRRDSASLADTLEHLAGSRPDPELASELGEEAAWQVALHLDDLERARELFRTAGSLSAGRVGPPLGRYFTAARQGEPPDQVDPIAALAPIAGGAEAALWLRSAAIHEVNGDRDTAAAHVGSALVASPDDAGALVVAAEFAPVAANGDATVWRKRAELMRRRAELCDDPITRDHWDLESAEALERAGQLHDAGRVIGEVLGRRPDNMRALQALRRLCRRGGDRATLAMASLSLARVLGDRESQLALLREAAAILDREQGNVEAAVPVYRRVVAVEPFGAEYDRLHDIYVDNEDLGGLFDLLSDRLNLLEDAAAKVPVWIERARARCALGDVAGAARDLEAALAEDANRADAIREHGRVLVALGQPKRAAAALRRYLELVDDPAARADAELELSQLLAEAMDDPAGAIAQLDAVLVQKPDDIELRERMVALLLRAGDAQRAVDEVRAIEKLRGAPPERARDELRIARLYRDELGKRDRARKALERARQLDPRNIDAVRELAELATDGKDRGRILRHAASDARAAIAEAPMNAPGYERLAVIAQWMDDADARYFAVGGLAAVGTVPAEHKEFAAAHAKVVRGRALASGSPVSADDWTTRLRHARGGGIAGELWLAIAEAVGSLLPHEPSLLGFGRGDRVGGRHFERDFPAVHAVTTAFGVPGFDLYVSSEKEKYARVVSFDKPVVYLSADVAAAKTPEAAFALGRAMAMARDGTGALADLRGDEVTAMFAAAAVIAGVDPGSVDAIAGVAGEAHDERVKAMNKAIARRAKKNLAVLASRFGELAAPHEWARAMMSTAARAGVLVAGDLGAALDVLDVGRGGRALADDPWALDLLAWAVGEDHLALRTKLGLRG